MKNLNIKILAVILLIINYLLNLKFDFFSDFRFYLSVVFVYLISEAVIFLTNKAFSKEKQQFNIISLIIFGKLLIALLYFIIIALTFKTDKSLLMTFSIHFLIIYFSFLIATILIIYKRIKQS